MRKIICAAALSVSGLCLTGGPALADYTLNILHFNDWHSRIESINKFESTCSAEDEGKDACFGGAARLKTAIDQEREKLKGENVILLNAGDNFQGSLFYSTYKGAVEAEFLNLFKVDVMTVGNHEFDDGEPGLATFMDNIKIPVISANVLPSHKSKLGDRIKPSIVLDVGGQKIGVVGAVANDTDQISSPGPDVLIGNDVAAISAAVAELKKQGIDKIVALTHVGYPRDMEAIARIPDVDVVVGGHSHTLLSNTDSHAAGPYPTFVENPDGYKVPIVQAASYSKYLGEFRVVFDDNGVVKEAEGAPIPLDARIKPDEAVLARVKELAGPIEEMKAKVVSATTAAVDGSRDSCRARECSMGDLVTDAMLDRVKDQGVTIAITNGGGLRASIDAGTVTMGEVLAVLPFQNTLATFQLSGKDVVASLEGGLAQIEEGAGRFPQVAGLRYSFDRSVAPNSGRVKSVEVRDGDQWKPIEPEKLYMVASNNFMRAGGDGYTLFRDKAQNAYDYGPGLEEVLATYLAAHNPFTPATDGRISDVTPKVVDSAKAEAPKAETAQAPAATPPATAGEVKTPELPAMSQTLATQPPTLPAGEAARIAAETQKKAEAAAQPAAAAAPSGGSHVVAAGDSYWKLAAKYYGNGALWKKIADANPAQKNRQLAIGSTLKIPAK